MLFTATWAPEILLYTERRRMKVLCKVRRVVSAGSILSYETKLKDRDESVKVFGTITNQLNVKILYLYSRESYSEIFNFS